MSGMRYNPVLQEWVVTATHRQDRTFLPPAGYCPLCPTSPGGFPTEVDEPAYDFVVFDNKFPSLKYDPEYSSKDDAAAAKQAASDDLYPVRPSQGVCEVVLYSSNHTGTLTDLPLAKLQQLVRVWRDRYEDLGARPDIDYVFIFENKGEAIGVTIHHPHGQIYAFSFIPPKVERAIKSEVAHLEKTGRCLHCDVIAEERKDGRRIVAESTHFVAFIPFYARYPYEVHIYAKAHLGSLSDFDASIEDDLGAILQVVLKKYDGLWQISMPYMMVMHQRPTDGQDWPGSHFHIEFYPPLRTPQKLKYLAGCESGAGTFVNDTLPEEKAAELRAVEVSG
jgi:UDPglucose--hexose-1-phosphate uridylyltransferase